MSSAFWKSDVDIKVEQSECAGYGETRSEKLQKPSQPPKSTVAAREDKECRVITALRNWLSRPRINKDSLRATAGGILISTHNQPSLDLCLFDVFASSRRRFQLSLKDKLLFDSNARAAKVLCRQSHCFTPRAEARFAFEQLHLDGNPIHKALRFDFNMAIKHPAIMDRSVIINVVPNQPGDFVINIQFLDHPVPESESQAVPTFHVGKVKKRTQYDGNINLVPGAASGVTLSFCRACDGFKSDMSVSDMSISDDDASQECDTCPSNPPEHIPDHFAFMSEEHLRWELVKYNALERDCPLINGHGALVAQCAIKVLYENGRYWPRLQTMPN